MKKIWIALASKVAGILIDALLSEFRKKDSVIYQVIADNFCSVLLEEMARDVIRRDEQLQKSVERIRSNKSDGKE